MDNNLPIVFTSCDLLYFYRFAESFVKSASSSGHEVKIIVTTDDKLYDIKPYIELKTRLETIDGVSIDIMSNDAYSNLKRQFNVDDVKSFYASLRFIILYEMLLNVSANRPNRDFVVLDIDSIINKAIQPIQNDVGLFFREPKDFANEYEKIGMMIAAGIVYVKNSSLGRKFAYNLLEEIYILRIRWFSDQVALYKNFLRMKNEIKFHAYDQKTLDWDFDDESVIWSAKGERKNTNDKYLKKKAEIENGI